MSTITESKTQYTPEDLLTMPDGKNYELVDGQLVERDVSFQSSHVAVKLSRRLDEFCEAQALGWIAVGDCGYQCFPDAPGKVRRPDVSFVRAGRLTAEQMVKGHVRIAPDLAVEVVSPNDLAYEVDIKINEYLRAGVRLVWVVYPPTQTVSIRRADGTASTLQESDDLSGEDVLPGFLCPVAALFPTLPAAHA